MKEASAPTIDQSSVGPSACSRHTTLSLSLSLSALQADAYSFGVVMWELATSARPYRGYASAETIACLVRALACRDVCRAHTRTRTCAHAHACAVPCRAVPCRPPPSWPAARWRAAHAARVCHVAVRRHDGCRGARAR